MGCGQVASARTRAVGCSKGGVTGDETKCTDAGTKPATSFACLATNACGKRSWRQARWPQYLPTPKKVTWAYYYLAQAHVTAAQIIAQKINYVVVSFAAIETDGSVFFPGGGCNSPNDVAGCDAGIAKLKADGWFKELHDAGVVIGISIGGAHAKIPKTVDASAAVKFAKNLENHGILKYVHALDLDWETTSPPSLTNSEMGKVINQVSLIFKNAGWIVTTAPMASQLHSGCGFGWQGNMNDMAELDHANFDGILLQWYQTSCVTLGHCPKAVCGLTPGADCFDLDWAATMISNFETVGACSKDGTQTGKSTWADCTAPAVKSTCKTIPVEKITVGGGLYYKSTWRQPDGILTAQNIFDLDAKLGGRLQGAGAWSINFGLVGGNKPAGDHSKPSDPNFFPDLGTKWKIVLPPTRRRLSLGSGSSSSSSSSSPPSPWRQLASGSCSGKPAGVQVCPVAAKCPTIQTHKWVAGPWEPETCETSCGLASSSRSRTVTCQASTTADGVIVGDSKCATAGLAPGKGSVCPATAPCAPVTGTTSSSPVPTSTACARESAFQGFANPLDVSKTKTTAAIMALQEIPAASAKDWPTAPMVTYAGGSKWPTGFSFDSCERMGHYDFVLIGFNDRWEKSATKNCKAPQTGSIGFPYLNTAACVGGEQDANLDGCMMNPCGAPIGKQILAAQKKGQRILLSVGGAKSPDVNQMTPQKGIDLAKAIWEVYLGGSDPAYLDYRPFGPHVVLDGVDLDIEDQPADCPTGCGCAAGQLGWKHFVQHLRALMDTDARKKYLLTTVPINSKQTSSFGNFGAYVQGYFNGPHCQANVWEDCKSPDSKCAKLLGTVNPESYLAIAWSHLDFIWPQFYPTPVEITMNSPCWWNDWMSWRRIAQGLWQPSAANKQTGSGRGGAIFKNNCRVGIGFPFAPDAASGGSLNGFTTAAFAKKQLESKWSSTSGKVGSAADLTEGWGGMMGWDEFWSWNTDKNKHTRELACANKNVACEKKAGNMVGADHCTCFDAKTCPVAPSGSTGGSTGGTARCGKNWGDANGRCGTSCPSKTNAECTVAGETCFASLKTCGKAGGATGSTTATLPAVPTTTDKGDPGGADCVTHAEMIAINKQSGYWPECDPSQATKGSVDRSSYVFTGKTCSAPWAKGLNVMLRTLKLCGADASSCEIRHRFLAQVAAETGYLSTLGQPLDNGKGLIHMIPANWQINVDDMDSLYPGEGIKSYFATLTDTQKAEFFTDPRFAWKSAGAWMKLTNRVIGTCGKDLFQQPFAEMGRCIFSKPVDRSEAYGLVGKALKACSSSTGSTSEADKAKADKDKAASDKIAADKAAADKAAPSSGDAGSGCLGGAECASGSCCWWACAAKANGCEPSDGKGCCTTGARRRLGFLDEQYHRVSGAARPDLSTSAGLALAEAAVPSLPLASVAIDSAAAVVVGGGRGRGLANTGPCAACNGPNQKCVGAAGTTDEQCAPCAKGQSWWPCATVGSCWCWDTTKRRVVPAPSTGLAVAAKKPCDVFTEANFNTLTGGKQKAPYTYAGFCKAIDAYNADHDEKVFMMGTLEQQKAEIAAFGGNTMHESDDYRAPREYLPCADSKTVGGKVYCKPCDSSTFDWTNMKCPVSKVAQGQIFNDYCQPTSSPPEACSCAPVKGGTGELEGYIDASKVFLGRGAIQLSWNYNYIKASIALTGSADTFCNNPDLVATKEEYAWGAGIYFWMENLKGRAEKGGAQTTCHMEALNHGEVGGTLYNINGGLECPASSHGWHAKAVKLRINRYCRAATAMGVSALLKFDGCKGMKEAFHSCDTASECPDCVAWRKGSTTTGTTGNTHTTTTASTTGTTSAGASPSPSPSGAPSGTTTTGSTTTGSTTAPTVPTTCTGAKPDTTMSCSATAKCAPVTSGTTTVPTTTGSTTTGVTTGSTTSGVTYQWVTGAWDQSCPSACGGTGGVARSRSVICKASDGTIVDNSKCGGASCTGGPTKTPPKPTTGTTTTTGTTAGGSSGGSSGGSTVDAACGACRACLWKSAKACYKNWNALTCAAFEQDGYLQCYEKENKVQTSNAIASGQGPTIGPVVTPGAPVTPAAATNDGVKCSSAGQCKGGTCQWWPRGDVLTCAVGGGQGCCCSKGTNCVTKVPAKAGMVKAKTPLSGCFKLPGITNDRLREATVLASVKQSIAAVASTEADTVDPSQVTLTVGQCKSVLSRRALALATAGTVNYDIALTPQQETAGADEGMMQNLVQAMTENGGKPFANQLINDAALRGVTTLVAASKQICPTEGCAVAVQSLVDADGAACAIGCAAKPGAGSGNGSAEEGFPTWAIAVIAVGAVVVVAGLIAAVAKMRRGGASAKRPNNIEMSETTTGFAGNAPVSPGSGLNTNPMQKHDTQHLVNPAMKRNKSRKGWAYGSQVSL
jgi:hypothetical protein